MRSFKSLIPVLLFLLLCLNRVSVSAQSQLETALKNLPAVASVEKLESPVFPEKYLLKVTRPVNPEAAGEMTPNMQTYVKYLDKGLRSQDKGTFLQRVILCHKGFDRPTVIVTEGYWASYALRPNYQEELSRILDANIVVVEYRYFGESCPKEMDWNYLTVGNSLSDLHQVNQMLRTIYKSKWIATGISKGGQTTTFYTAYYPEDMDVSVPYVAPLNKSVEDGRHEPFLSKQVSTAQDRQIVEDYMMRLVKNRDVYVPLFIEHCKKKGYTFRLPMEEMFDLTVLELRFALWQYGTPISSIPKANASVEEQFKFFIELNDPEYFSEQHPYYSFDVQAAKELGYYGYDMKPFKKYMAIKSTKDYLRRVLLGKEESSLRFDATLYKHTVNFLKKNDPKMIFIYGGVDPWGSSGVCTWLDSSKKQNLKIYVKEDGSHSTRIGSFEDATQNEIISTIKRWIGQ